jgi:hypothetical protein
MHNQEKDKVSLLFSGGKDSSLAALILSKIFIVELVTVTFGVTDNWRQAEKVAQKLRLPFRVLKLNKEIIEKATEQVVKEGYPKNGIKYIHQVVLEEIAKESEIVADGVRRNDRVPVLSLSEITSFEDKFNVHYIQPLMGYSRKTINLLLDKYFKIKEYRGDSFPGAEYEFELRELIKQKYGSSKVAEIFPSHHTHSVVLEVKT